MDAVRPDLRQIEMLQAIARHGSVTRAAEEFNVTQPAISMQLRKFEAEVGFALVERSGRSVRLTEAGEEVLRHADRIASILDDLRESLDQLRGVNRGNLRLAVASTANYFIPEYIARFRKEHPGVGITLNVANRDSILGLLGTSEADLAITGQPPGDSDLIARAFKDNPLVVIAPPDHPLASEADVSASQLIRYPFVMRERGSGTRAAMERAFAAHRLEYRVSCVMSSNEAVKQAVLAGLGLAVISHQTTELEAETGRLAVLQPGDLEIRRRWFVVYRSFRRLPPAALAFRKLLLPSG